MSRHPTGRAPRRLQRMRAPSHRPLHGLDARRAGPAVDDDASLRALVQENALLARELGRVQARCTRWREDCAAQAGHLEAQLVRLRGTLMAKVTELAALRDNPGAPPMAPPALEARRVLCVGGRARQVPIYRALVERGGGHFERIDGNAAEALPALRRALAHADLVILQPAFACRVACRLVQQHCALRGVHCVQLDKTCALGFIQGLEQALSLWGDALRAHRGSSDPSPGCE